MSSPPAAPSPPTNAIDLRPLSTGELIDRGFALYRAHFAGFLLFALVCQTVPLILSQGLTIAVRLLPAQQSDPFAHPATDLGRAGLLFALWLVGQIVTFSLEVAMTLYLADAYLGRTPSIKSALGQAVKSLSASLSTCLLNIFFVGLALLLPVLALVVIVIYGRLYPAGDFISALLFLAVGGLVFIVSLVPVLLVFMRLMLTVPAVALEKLAGWAAARRSSQLVRFDPGLGFFYWGEMRLSLLLLPLFVIELLILFVASFPAWLHQLNETLRHGAVGQINAPPDVAVVMSQIFILLSGALLLPLYLIATTLFYFDIRIRREGFDLEFMAQRLEGAS
jgi:hypothetical protein